MEDAEKKAPEEKTRPSYSDRVIAAKRYREANPNPPGWEDWMVIYDLNTVEQKKELIRQLKRSAAQKKMLNLLQRLRNIFRC